MYLNLSLAVFWFALGIALLAWHWIKPPGSPDLVIWGTDFSMGWVCVALGFYNVTRWWSTRSYLAQRRALEEGMAQRHRLQREHHPDREPDPNFMFTDQPPPPPPARPEGGDGEQPATPGAPGTP